MQYVYMRLHYNCRAFCYQIVQMLKVFATDITVENAKK